MDINRVKNIDILDDLIVGRVSPHIYAFKTNTFPDYLKVGDTYRSVNRRLNEWKRIYPDLEEKFSKKAIINKDTYYRDYSVHRFLENDLNISRIDYRNNEELYISNEFFEKASIDDLFDAIKDIEENFDANTGKYDYYSIDNKQSKEFTFRRGSNWDLRPNQKEAVDNFMKAYESGRRNLLMYAVMRFGKSFTSLYCALEMDAKVVLVVSGKADVKIEWKKTVETARNFEDCIFIDSDKLLDSPSIIHETLDAGKKAVIFSTLQDLQGDIVKEKHLELFNTQIDLMIIDETHFGARAQFYGQIIENAGYDIKDKKNLNQVDKLENDEVEIEEADKNIKQISAKVRLHLSGTPYRILMGSEFEPEDIISFVQFSDIVEEQKEWDIKHLNRDEVEEWDNPYFGFPQMIRFAFHPNKSSIEKMNQMKELGINYELSKLLEPKSINYDREGNKHKEFINEKEVLDLLQVIDGSKQDENVLGFLNYEKLKEGKMCRHMVMVLPYCASCDSMETLINNNNELFLNLNEYEIINISGVEGAKKYKSVQDIKRTIRDFEKKNKKTITLTVNRMLTGSTVEEWDTMIYLKDTSSPQEYDQAIFRLQNQYIRELKSNHDTIKENLKPQTLLVDFSPKRLFYMQEQKSFIYNVNTEINGNSKLTERMEAELNISPIITMNHNKIEQVTAKNIIDTISEYNKEKSVTDEVIEIPVDLGILVNDEIRKVIESQAEFNSKLGLFVDDNYEGEGEQLSFEDFKDLFDEKIKDRTLVNDPQAVFETETSKDIDKLESKMKTYYQRLLFFAFLIKNKVSSVEGILEVFDFSENKRIANNLHIDKKILYGISRLMNPYALSKLDYKIKNISDLANDESITPLERATTSIKKFSRMSESEVITPDWVCKDMINLIPNDSYKEIIEKKEIILDLGTKSGEFAVAGYQKLINEIGMNHEDVSDLIYAIPTSSVAYEFTRRFYEILGLNVDNISANFNAYDLLDVKVNKKEVDYKKLENLLTSGIKFNKLVFNEKNVKKEGEGNVKFGAVVGNPPYNVSDGGAQASSKPIYHNFVYLGQKITKRYASFITPTRWYAGGKGLDQFRKDMLNNENLVVLYDILTPEDIFPGTNNRGGICYYLIDKLYKNKNTIKLITVKDNKVISKVERELKIEGIDIFIRDNIGVDLIKQIGSQKPMSTEISSRKPFGLEGNILKSNKFKKISTMDNSVSSLRPFGFRGYFTKSKEYKESSKGMINPVLCYGKGRQVGFVERSLIGNNTEYIDSWKVFIPRANNIGTELNDNNLNSFVGEPNTICTESYIMVGADLDLDENSANNLAVYLRTSFARYFHSLAKISQDSTSKTFKFVPLQNFNENSDINWDKEIDEIDRQLFKKYGLTEEQINHIKLSIS